jgi:peptide/nickel transport system substrate-binding protein
MAKDSNCDSDDNSGVSRRKILAATAGGSIGAIAGCSGGNNQNDGTSTTTSKSNNDNNETTDSNDNNDTSQKVDRQFFRRTATNPAEQQFNHFSTAGTEWLTMSLIHGFGAQQTKRAPVGFVPLLVKNWNMDGTTFTMELNDQFTWHDGKNVTADDIVMQYELCDYMQAGKHYGPLELLDGLPEATGSHSIEMTLTEKMNPDIFLDELFGEPYLYEPNFFKPYVEKFRDASTDDEKKAVRTELTETNLDEPVGFGPVKLKSRDSQKAVFEFHDGYPFESVQQQVSDVLDGDYTDWGRPNFDEIVSKLITSENKNTQEILSGSIDAAGTSIQDENRLQSGSLMFVPYLHGQTVNFNMWDWGEEPGPEWLTDPETSQLVRKALAHAIDREAAGIQLGNGNPINLDPLQTGLRSGQEEEWLDQSLRDKMNDWERDLDKAAEYMREAGFEKQNGTWVDSDGNKLSPTLREGAGVTRYVNGMDVINSNLQEFGINSEVSMESNSTYFGKDDNDSGTDIGIEYWGGAGAHPYSAFDWMFNRLAVQRENGDYDYMLPGDETVEVPPVGEPDSDETITVDPKKLVSELGATLDDEREQEIVNKLAWATNQSVPQISTNERASAMFLDTENWETPSLDDQALYMTPPANMIFHLGIIDAKPN